MTLTACARFTERVGVVTGGASGIGRATALRLAAEGAAVVVADSRQSDADRTATDIKAAGGSAIGVGCDVSNEDDVGRLMDRCVEEFGQLDVLANVAGITTNPKKPIDEITTEEFGRILSVNLMGTFLGMKHAIPLMKARQYGRIVNTSSIAAFLGLNAGNAPYGASKGGVIALTKQAVADVSSFGITVNVVAPGIIRTAMNEQYGEEWRERTGKRIPLGRVGMAEDLAAAIAFLASDDAGYITGHVLTVDGGLTSSLHRG